MAWTSFKQYKEFLTDWFSVSMPKQVSIADWTNSECECRTYFKLYMCEHIIGIALRKKLVAAPPEAKNVPLGVKRKRGRPRKAQSALVIQDEED